MWAENNQLRRKKYLHHKKIDAYFNLYDSSCKKCLLKRAQYKIFKKKKYTIYSKRGFEKQTQTDW